MFARVKKSRREDYLQIVESYRDSGKVRQRVVLYIGHYTSVGDALELIPKELRYLRRRANEAEKHAATSGLDPKEAELARRRVDDLAAKLDALRRLLAEHPDLQERDRQRAERHGKRQREATAARMAARVSR